MKTVKLQPEPKNSPEKEKQLARITAMGPEGTGIHNIEPTDGGYQISPEELEKMGSAGSLEEFYANRDRDLAQLEKYAGQQTDKDKEKAKAAALAGIDQPKFPGITGTASDQAVSADQDQMNFGPVYQKATQTDGDDVSGTPQDDSGIRDPDDLGPDHPMNRLKVDAYVDAKGRIIHLNEKEQQEFLALGGKEHGIYGELKAIQYRSASNQQKQQIQDILAPLLKGGKGVFGWGGKDTTKARAEYIDLYNTTRLAVDKFGNTYDENLLAAREANKANPNVPDTPSTVLFSPDRESFVEYTKRFASMTKAEKMFAVRQSALIMPDREQEFATAVTWSGAKNTQDSSAGMWAIQHNFFDPSKLVGTQADIDARVAWTKQAGIQKIIEELGAREYKAKRGHKGFTGEKLTHRDRIRHTNRRGEVVKEYWDKWEEDKKPRVKTIEPSSGSGGSGSGSSETDEEREERDKATTAAEVGVLVKEHEETNAAIQEEYDETKKARDQNKKDTDAAKKKAYEDAEAARKKAADLEKGKTDRAAERAERDAALDAFDPNAEDRFNRARELIAKTAQNEQELVNLQHDQAAELLRFKGELQQRNLAGLEGINAATHKETMANLARQRERINMITQRQQDDLLANFKDSMSATIKGMQKSLSRDMQDLDKVMARGGVYQQAEQAAVAARKFAGIAAQQRGSVSVQNKATFARNAAKASRQAVFANYQEKIKSYDKIGKTFSNQLKAASRTHSLAELRGLEATYETELERMLDELYERN